MTTIAAIGEGMVELTHRGSSDLRLAYAGDTLNTAIYLARMADDQMHVEYVTAVGDDPYSDELVERLASEPVGSRLTWRRTGHRLGLYLVRTDASGERAFTYYRSASAATGLFGPGHDLAVDAMIAAFDVVYLSLITLQILAPEGRVRLWHLLDAVRAAGGIVVFDTNFRPSGWPDTDTARSAARETLRRTDIALPTWSDEQALFGDPDPVACAHRLRGLGVAEGVVKNGAQPCLVFNSATMTEVPAEAVPTVIDTTAAGDAFNAAFLAARVRGVLLDDAARAGHKLASQVIQHPGAIIPPEAMPLPTARA